ncbi:MAG: hypothetical protein GXP55_23010 [Deltaproteobacteria bacterium]|nr:hypothetical protein [Deltaproteobacteria bacterium]
MDTLPAEEACDGVDNDCDGAVDEGCPCTAGQTQGCGSEFAIAPCSAGTQTCGTDGTWSSCEGAIGPSAESCGTGDGDGIDNDCDGTVDEGCTCVPEPEVCSDGVDNDCDGTVDEAACTLSSGIDGGMDGGDPIPPGCGPTPASLCDLDACTTTLWTRPRELSGYAAELASRGSAAPIHGVRLLPEVDRAVLVFSDGAFDGTYHDADRWLIWDLASGNKLGAVDTGSVRLTEGPGSGEGEFVALAPGHDRLLGLGLDSADGRWKLVVIRLDGTVDRKVAMLTDVGGSDSAWPTAVWSDGSRVGIIYAEGTRGEPSTYRSSVRRLAWPSLAREGSDIALSAVSGNRVVGRDGQLVIAGRGSSAAYVIDLDSGTSHEYDIGFAPAGSIINFRGTGFTHEIDGRGRYVVCGKTSSSSTTDLLNCSIGALSGMRFQHKTIVASVSNIGGLSALSVNCGQIRLLHRTRSFTLDGEYLGLIDDQPIWSPYFLLATQAAADGWLVLTETYTVDGPSLMLSRSGCAETSECGGAVSQDELWSRLLMKACDCNSDATRCYFAHSNQVMNPRFPRSMPEQLFPDSCLAAVEAGEGGCVMRNGNGAYRLPLVCLDAVPL